MTLAFARVGQYALLRYCNRMGANMRRFIVLCAAFAFVSGASAAVAQTQPATHAKHAAARKNAAQPAPPPADTRPRYKRDDVPVPVVTVPAATAARAAEPKRGAAPKAAAVQPVPSPADPRPRYKRDDVPAPVAATPAVAAKRHHTVRKLPSEDFCVCRSGLRASDQVRCRGLRASERLRRGHRGVHARDR